MTSSGVIATRFHNMLVEMILAVARHFDTSKVALSGGCFQNRYLTERVINHLRRGWFQTLLAATRPA